MLLCHCVVNVVTVDMHHVNCRVICLQVELNTISSSFGCLCTKMRDWHWWIMKRQQATQQVMLLDVSALRLWVGVCRLYFCIEACKVFGKFKAWEPACSQQEATTEPRQEQNTALSGISWTKRTSGVYGPLMHACLPYVNTLLLSVLASYVQLECKQYPEHRCE